MVVIEGYIGPENSPLRRPARVFIERTNSNIPACSSSCTTPRTRTGGRRTRSPSSTRRNCPAPGDYPDGRLVTIDLDNWVTRVFNIDYFGESKMGGLRMWMEWAYQQGALAMHAGRQGDSGRRR